MRLCSLIPLFLMSVTHYANSLPQRIPLRQEGEHVTLENKFKNRNDGKNGSMPVKVLAKRDKKSSQKAWKQARSGSKVAGSTISISNLEKEAGIDLNAPLTAFDAQEILHDHPQGFKGFDVKPAIIKQIAVKLKLVSDFDVIREKLKGQLSQYAKFALAGVVITLALMEKLALVPASKFANEREASKVYGTLKLAGINGDATTIKKLIGDTKGLTDAELIHLWGHNEHNNLHSAFITKGPLFKAAHMTSLNSWLQEKGIGPTPNAADFPAGGANNSGWGYEPGWFEAAKSVLGMLG